MYIEKLNWCKDKSFTYNKGIVKFKKLISLYYKGIIKKLRGPHIIGFVNPDSMIDCKKNVQCLIFLHKFYVYPLTLVTSLIYHKTASPHTFPSSHLWTIGHIKFHHF